MNNLISRTAALLACALSLASCGGSEGNLSLQGWVRGLTKPEVQLRNNDGPIITVKGNSTGKDERFQIDGLEADDRFNIQIVKQPDGATCQGFDNVGKMGGYSFARDVIFVCKNDPKNLGGRLAAPLSYDVTLNNGRDQVTVQAGQTTFTFTTKNAAGETIGTVGHGEPYGVTVLKPLDKNCTVQNGTGTMLNDFNDVLVTCQ